MIHHLDNLLGRLLSAQITGIDETQISFEPPDEAFRNTMSNNNLLNIYLVDVRENRKLRSNARLREFDSGIVHETPAPRRIDAHYLVSAWSPATVTMAVQPTLDEHELLAEVISVLMDNEPLVPRQIFDPIPPNFPAALVDCELPTTILPVEGFAKLAEFWGTVEWRWKPVVYLIVTYPNLFDRLPVGPMVTTRITEYRQTGKPETAEVFIQIGGTVRQAGGTAIGGAWVRLETTTGAALQTTYTDEREAGLGRFTFLSLQAGDYQIRVRAAGFSEKVEPVTVPSPAGGYDIEVSF